MKILVIGGSYFLGKCFVKKAYEKHEITVYNRGNRPLNLEGIREVIADRGDYNALSALAKEQYEVIVDFCAYQKKDIETVFRALHQGLKQYIFVSTSDIYERGLHRMLDEESPLETRDFGGETGAYILGKVALEKELFECGTQYGVAHTSIRPAFIYGPENYAPREGIYFHWIREAGQIIHPFDATGEFQMVYVEDVAKAILNAIGNENSYSQAYNLAPGKMETYDSFADALEEVYEKPFEKVLVPVELVVEKMIPLPFPLTKEESNYYDGRKALGLIGQYTELVEGLKNTLNQENV